MPPPLLAGARSAAGGVEIDHPHHRPPQPIVTVRAIRWLCMPGAARMRCRPEGSGHRLWVQKQVVCVKVDHSCQQCWRRVDHSKSHVSNGSRSTWGKMELAGDSYSRHSPGNVVGEDKAVGLELLSPALLRMVSLLLLTPRSLMSYTPGCAMTRSVELI